ncbi:hypothetical protein [Dyella japonica]|uniref:hypothetical protein n=1 Tax=Dyella japonica TaxID=231455 RepID=UPI000584C3EB|nr:hypothetical protein [Dyella japonica]
MNLFHSFTGRIGPGRRRAGRRFAPPGRLYNIRYAMTPRGPRRVEVELRSHPLTARWTRDPATGQLRCQWHVASAHGSSHAALSSLRQAPSMPRRDIHADMRPPTR